MIQTDIFKIMADEYLTGVTEPVVKKTMPQGLGARSSMSIKNDAAEANKIEPIKMGGAVDTIAKYYNKIIAEQIKDSRGNVSTDKGAEYTPVSYSAILDGAQDVSSAGYDFDKVLRDSARTGKLSSATPPRNLKSDILTKIEYNLSTEIEARNAKVAKKDGIPLVKPDFIDRLIDRVAEGIGGKPSEDDAADVSLIKSEEDTSLLSKSPKDAKFLRGEGLDESLSDEPKSREETTVEKEARLAYENQSLEETDSKGLMSSLRPQKRPDLLTSIRPEVRPESFNEAETAPEITATVAEALPPEAGTNPLSYVFNSTLMGLDEENTDHQAAIKGFLNTAVGNTSYVTDKSDVTKNSFAWCAGFVDGVLRDLGYSTLNYGKDKYNRVRAKEYQSYGSAVENTEEAKPGDLVILQNPKTNRYHVSFFVGLTEDGKILALGGNQENTVKVSSYNTTALRSIRRISNVADMDPEELKKITGTFVEVPDDKKSES